MGKFLYKFLVVLLLILPFMACNNSTSGNSDKKTTKQETKEIFDVSALMGKDIDDVRKVLGKPSDKDIEPTKLQLQKDIGEWDNNFEKADYSLLVTFSPKTRKIVDYFVGTNDPSGTTNDYSDLLKICNVKSDDAKYSIEPVHAAIDNSRYTGIKIVPK